MIVETLFGFFLFTAGYWVACVCTPLRRALLSVEPHIAEQLAHGDNKGSRAPYDWVHDSTINGLRRHKEAIGRHSLKAQHSYIDSNSGLTHVDAILARALMAKTIEINRSIK